MDSKDFVEYLKSILNNYIKSWENSILSGTLSKDIPYERAIGILEAWKGIIGSIDVLHGNFKKGHETLSIEEGK